MTLSSSLERGLNPLFSDRAQEIVLHDAPLQSELPKKGQPDRVYGLRATKNFERLLSIRMGSHSTEDQASKDLKTSPFRQDGEPLLFPFLVLEAKSEKGADSFLHTDSVKNASRFTCRRRRADELLRRTPGLVLCIQRRRMAPLRSLHGFKGTDITLCEFH
jgi:hypothetical protein